MPRKLVNSRPLYGCQWQLWQEESGGYLDVQLHTLLLQEIRDELKQLNRLLGCRNFLDIPTRLRAIDRSLKATKKQKE